MPHSPTPPRTQQNENLETPEVSVTLGKARWPILQPLRRTRYSFICMYRLWRINMINSLSFHPVIDYTKYLLGGCCVLGSALGWDTVLWKTQSLPPSTQYSGEEQPVNKLTSECSARCQRWEVKQMKSSRRRTEMEEGTVFVGKSRTTLLRRWALILVSVGYRPTDTYLEECSIGQQMQRLVVWSSE